MLEPQQSRGRQQRLLAAMAELKLHAVVLGARHHVYWAAAFRSFWLHESAFVLFADGTSWLACANEPAKDVAADTVVAFPATIMGTQRQDQPAAAAEMVLGVLALHHAGRIGVDASAVGSAIAMSFGGQAIAIDPTMWQLRRPKDADELGLMRKAIAASEAMHRRAREMIAPGVSELRVFNELSAAAVEALGEPMGDRLGNDYSVGAMGGPPGEKIARAGQLYILDVGPNYRGYFADNARTYAVDRKPTEEQMRAWRAIVGVFPIVERMAKAGVRCRELFEAADAHLREEYGEGLPHHLGHGVGLQPHEFPHLNPKHWDDVLVEGEVFTVEPGIYGEKLAGGIRVENQYLVKKEGVENLVDVGMEMA